MGERRRGEGEEERGEEELGTPRQGRLLKKKGRRRIEEREGEVKGRKNE